MKPKVTITLFTLILVIVGGLYIFNNQANKTVETEPVIEKPIVAEATSTPSIPPAVFTCISNKSITAEFSKESVKIKLSDGRNLELPQTISGSGARYANQDESIVFWNKGDTAFIEENGKITFTDCVTTP